MSKKKQECKHIYQLELTERQARILSYACDHFSRLICGQDLSYQELFVHIEKHIEKQRAKSVRKRIKTNCALNFDNITIAQIIGSKSKKLTKI